jgi:hypothetical protein
MFIQSSALYAENFAWQTDEVSVPFAEAAIAVSFTNCSAEGPLEEALSGYDWIEFHWPQVRSLIQEQAFAFYEPYADAVPGVPRFDAADQLWGTEVLLSIELSSKHQFSITMRFEWQEEDDPHQITFYVVDGRCQTHSVDG